MNWRVTGALVAVALALVAFVVFVEAPKGQPRVMNVTPYPTTLPAIVAVEDGAVQRITLTRVEDGAVVALARDEAGAWQVMVPVTGPADAWAVGSLLGALSSLVPNRRFEPGAVAPADVGLDPPRVVAEAELEDGERVRLLLGDDNPQGTALYAQVAGDDAVYLINRGLMMQATDMFETPPLEPTPTPTLITTATPAE